MTFGPWASPTPRWDLTWYTLRDEKIGRGIGLVGGGAFESFKVELEENEESQLPYQ